MDMPRQQEPLPLPSVSVMNRLWREREQERDRERIQIKQRQEATPLKRASTSHTTSTATATGSTTSSSTRSREAMPLPRSAMAKLFASSSSGAIHSNTGASTSSASFLSRPQTQATPSIPLDKQQEMETTELRFRRSLPSTSGRSAQDLAWALQSVLQNDPSHSHSNSSNASSSGSSSSSSGSSAVGSIITTTTTATTATASAARPSSSLVAVSTTSGGRNHLQRAQSAEVAPPQQHQHIKLFSSPFAIRPTATAAASATEKPPSADEDDTNHLRQQVTLLLRSLEEEKKRRAVEQKLMQQKILELQGLIRHNMPEQKKQLERSLQAPPSQAGSSCVVPTSRTRVLRATKQLHKAQVRSPYKTMKLLSELRPEQLDLEDEQEGGGEQEGGEGDDTDGEGQEDQEDQEDEDEDEDHQENNNQTQRRGDAATQTTGSETNKNTNSAAVVMSHQLTKLRARMRALLTESQQEAQSLQKLLEEERKAHDRKERQLRREASLRVTSLEERYAYAKKKLMGKTSLLATQLTMVTDEKQKLLQELHEKDLRIQQLELAVGGRRLVESTARNNLN